MGYVSSKVNTSLNVPSSKGVSAAASPVAGVISKAGSLRLIASKAVAYEGQI